MKLNGNIIYSELSKRFSADKYGQNVDKLCIGRPEFYMDNTDEFRSGHLYLASADHLPVRPRIQQNVVLVCIGDSLALNYYKERLLLIQIRMKADLFRVFAALQDIFEKYDEWERKLYDTAVGDCDIRRMIEDSEEILTQPLFVMNSSFRYVAESRRAGLSYRLAESEALDPEALGKFLVKSELLTEKHNAFILSPSDQTFLCVNLYTKDNNYAGCLYLELESDEAKCGEDRLSERLAEFIQLAMEKNPRLTEGSQSSIKKLMQNILTEQPLSRSQQVILKSADNSAAYLCLYIRSTEKYQKLPLNYICEVFEERFKDSYAFIYGDSIAAFLNAAPMKDDAARLSLITGLKSFCSSMKLSAGISNEFSELFDIRTHYIQAQAAAEDGLLLNPDDNLFFFSSYATTEMVINALGGLPAEAYYPEGLKKILEHDKNSSVSYLGTLRTFLEESMSYTAAAQRLFIHRSTLIDRLERIEKEMNLDLKNPEQRLQLEILLRAMDLEEIMSSD